MQQYIFSYIYLSNPKTYIFFMAQQPNKKPQLWQVYHQHDFIDAKDNQADWRVGYIVEKNNASKLYKVRFDGWQAKYDQIYRFNSHKLQEFRSIVIGYTGQVQNPGIRPGWKFSIAEHQQKIVKLKAYIKQPTNHTPHQINQFFRGHNYLYTDFLMTGSYNNPQHLASVFQYFKINIGFTCQYLNEIDPQFTLIYKARENQSYNHLNHNETAYRNSYFEILDSLYTIIGGYRRLTSFFKDNAQQIKIVLNKNQENVNIKRCYQMHMIIEFFNHKGFEILNQLISNKLIKAKNLTPFLFLKSLAQLYLGLSAGMKKTDKEEILRKLINLVELNFNKLTDKQLKEFHKSNVVSLLDLICQLHQGSQNEEKVKNWALIQQLDICLLMVKCPFFDKRLKGINGIIQLINRQHLNQQQCEIIKQWIENSKLFDILFVDCDNAQLIKKAAELTKHLDIQNILEKKYIYLIWKSRIGKHETALQQIYSLISTIPLRTKYDTIKHQLFEEIAKIPQNEWDDDYIKFIKDYSMNSISWNVTKIKNTFGFQILYQNLMNKKNQTAFQALIQLASKMQKTDFIVEFMTQCFLKIAQDFESDMHVEILVQLLKQQILEVDVSKVSMKEIIINDILRRQPRTQKQIKNRFEIFSQILKTSDAILTFQDLKLLWERFQNDQSRKPFYQWICTKNQGGKITINKHISGQIRSRFLLELWPLGEDDKFRKLIQEETIIMIELFKSANVLEKNIVRVNNSFRVQNMNLVGFKQIEKAFNEVQDLKVAERLANFISEIYMNPGANLLKKRQHNINTLLDNITSQIRSSLKLKQYWSIKKELLLTLKVINQDEQILPINYTPKFSAFKQFTVYHRERQEEKVIKFNIANLFYDFKRTVAEKFKIPIKNCKIYHKNELVKAQQLMKPMIQAHFGTAFEIHEIVAEDSLVKRGLIERLDTFFLLLGETQVQKQAWKIVSELPLSLKIIKMVENSRAPWNQLTNESIYLQLYMLKVANTMNDKWWSNFLATNGLTFLKDKLKKVKAKTQIEKQYLLIVTSLIDRGLLKKQPDTKIPLDLFLQCLAILHLMLKEISNKEQKVTFAQNSITKNIFSIGESISQINLPINLLIKQYKQHLDFLKLGLIVTKDASLRKEFLIQLKKITEIDEDISQQVLCILLQKLLQFAINYEQQSRLVEYFEYTSFILEKINKNILEQYLLKKNQLLVPKIITLIKAEKIQKNVEDVNYLLIGYLKILKHIISFSTIQEQKDISIYLIKECLFSDEEAKCKTKQSRMGSLNVLEKVFRKSSILNKDLPFLWELHKNGEWRSKKAEDWVISPNDKMKSSTGYVGIKNLGCICYMISFMQQIFMIPDFRQGILQCQDPMIALQHKQNVLYQIKKIMFNLSYSDKKYLIPREFCQAFKDIEGNPVNITQQMDIDEFSGILFDKLETQIKGTKHQNIIKDLFGGVFSNEIICKGCPHFSESQQSFLSVALTVKNKKDIYQSLDTMIKGDNLDGDNAYFCERCSKKVSAVKRLCFKKLPDYLILALKRFQFDFETMTKLKVNDYCEFPHELNIKNYSQQYLRQQENSKVLDDEDYQPDSYFQYELKGVVIHLGYADSGHYYSFIQQRKQNGKWFEFNDTIVRSFDPKRLPEQAYGGQVGQFQIKQKIKNAYLLIYDRKQKFKKPELTYENPYERRQYADIRKNVLQQNKLQKIESILFSEEYYKFLMNLLNSIHRQPPENFDKLLKFLILAYLTIVIRSKDENPAFAFLKNLHPVLINDVKTIEWVVLIFSQTKILDEFIKNNPAKDIKKLITNWLNSLWPYTKVQIQVLFFHAILQILTVNMENYIELCQILDSAVKRQNLCDYLVKKGIAGRLLQNLLRKQQRLFSSIDDIPCTKQKNQIGYEITPERVSNEKKLKTDLDNGYVFSILTQILGLCRQKNIPYQQYLTQQQVTLLNIPTNRISKILEECKTKFQIKSFVQYLCNLSYQNEALVEQLLNIIYTGLKSFQSKRYRQFFILYKHLSRVEDDLFQKRLAGFNRLIRGLKQNQKYSLDSDLIQQWIIKILKKNKPLQAYVAKQKQMLQYLIVLSTKKTPSEQIVRKNMSYIDAMLNKLHGIRFYRSKRGYLDNAKKKESIFSSIAANTQISYDNWNSDDDLTTQQVKSGDTIFYFDQKQHLDFLESKVQQAFMNRLTVVPKKGKTTQIWKDDQKLTLGYDLEDDDILSQQNSDKTTETQMDPDQLEELSDV